MGSSGGSAQAAWLWARRELGARWRSLVALGIIAGLAGGMVMAAAAGARRTATAFDRYRRATAAPDAIVFGTQVGAHNLPYEKVLQLPEVVDGGLFALAAVEVTKPRLGSLPPADERLYRTVARPLLIAGRLPDPRRPDEVVVNRQAASQYHLHVGDRLTVQTGNDLNAFYGAAPLTGGPSFDARIVGIGDSMMNHIFGPDEPWIIPSAAILTTYGQTLEDPHHTAAAPGRIAMATNLLVRLRPGTSFTAFQQRVAETLGQPDIPVRNLAEDRKRFVHGTDLERTGLAVFGAAVVLAGLVLVGQALARTVYAVSEPVPVLRAVGFTRRELVRGILAVMAPMAGVAAVTAVATAYLLSPRFPIGLAGRLDPDRGYHVDGPVFAVATLLLVALLVAGVVLFAVSATRAVRVDAPARRSRLARIIRGRAPLPIGIGAGLALESGAGRGQVPVRPAIVGAVAGVLGVVGAFGLLNGIDDAVAKPVRAGQVWDASVYPQDDQLPVAQVTDAVKTDPDIGEVAVEYRVPTDVGGAGLPVYALSPVRGALHHVILRGRPPVGDDEVALGPATLKALHQHIGGTVTIGTEAPRRFRIVGTTLLPQTPHSSFDQGAWTSEKALREVMGGAAVDGSDTSMLVRWRPGVASSRAIDDLGKYGLGGDPAAQAQDVLFLRNVRTLPRALAAFLVLLALAAVGHALVTAARRRRGDMAVLRAFGFRRRDVRACVHWQATVVAAIGLVLGLPLGVAIGRAAWRWVADRTPLVYVGPLPAVVAAVAIPAAVVLANALAGVPARRAARLRPVEVLRAE